MDDLIRKQDAINEISRWSGYLDDDMILRIKTGLKKLPSAQPEQQWIPRSERMPKEEGHYLVQTEDGITIMEYTFGNPHFHENPAFVSDVLGRCNGYVIAWMPLPEPLKGEADENDRC